MYTVYILRTSKNTLYTGISNNLEKRLKEHREKGKRSAKYMKVFDSFKLVHTKNYQTRSEALKREAKIKKLTKGQKEVIISISI
ncbi:MAG: GIY-YIG nuclease family protein [Candidatus Woesebacteria bacterium]|nr:GIY-YIG nuclease family protein [Candidatus Woesebacteria bacterium]